MTTNGRTLGVIGSGNIGGTVAQLAVDAGYAVVLSNSRGAETLAGLVDVLGPNARAATPAEAAAAGDLVLISVPLRAIDAMPVDALAGKVVLDTNNYYPDRDGHVAALDAKQTTTSQLLQDRLPSSHVVKVFNNIYSGALGMLSRPHGAADRATLLIAADDADARQAATEFLDAIGYDALDSGSLAESWRFERDQPAYALAYATDGDLHRFHAATAAELRPLLAAARR